jgi:alkanesulfonate monooxygenase SsuD/methylene tetrahydromethanopterin reductase-like flavin-dependent oxidoreductase (luciferase family)
VSRFATTAEEVGFDSFVFEDALLYRGAEVTQGSWESVSIAAALAATTPRIKIGQSVVNAPYRSPALIAKTAETLDEISGGRYLFGLGAGNTDDSDYAAFGFPTDQRYSRFAEAIEIIHGLLKDGSVDFDGEFHFAREAELVLRGPRPQGPPIIIAAAGPRMLRLVARYADEWNWWTVEAGQTESLRIIVEELETACTECDRDPASLRRSLDVYTVDPLGQAAAKNPEDTGLVTGSSTEIAETLLAFGELGFEEVRCDVYPKSMEGIEAMAGIVDRVHAG